VTLAAGTTLVTEDGVPIAAAHIAGTSDLGIVLAHGFTNSWRKPHVRRVAGVLAAGGAGVVMFDFRGHGGSGGHSTLGDLEVWDLDAALAWARKLGYRRVAIVGFSMGGSVVLRHAGLVGGADAVVSVSSPGRWYYRGTERMRWVHYAVERRLGRLVARQFLHTRISPAGWIPVPPVPPAEAAAKIAPVPLLIVHGSRDLYFPAEHARQIYSAAHEPKELWIIPGMGHAESGTSDGLAARIAAWADSAARSSAAAQERLGRPPLRCQTPGRVSADRSNPRPPGRRRCPRRRRALAWRASDRRT
jgi:fermentation-respiration switch protein FrsA (DUF1100 family)